MDGVLTRMQAAGFAVALSPEGRLRVGGELSADQAAFIRQYRETLIAELRDTERTEACQHGTYPGHVCGYCTGAIRCLVCGEPGHLACGVPTEPRLVRTAWLPERDCPDCAGRGCDLCGLYPPEDAA